MISRNVMSCMRGREAKGKVEISAVMGGKNVLKDGTNWSVVS